MVSIWLWKNRTMSRWCMIDKGDIYTFHMIVFSVYANMPSRTISYLWCQDKISQWLSVFHSLWLRLVYLFLSTGSQWHLYECSHSHKWLWFHWIKIHLCLLDTSWQRDNTFSPHNGLEAAEKLYSIFLQMLFHPIPPHLKLILQWILCVHCVTFRFLINSQSNE